MARILIVDDEDGIRRVLRQLLEYEGHEVRTAASGGEALEIFPEFRPELTFLDVKMARLDGLEVLVKLRQLDPHALVVMISGHGTIETAVEATRRGAYDFLEKPLDTDRILLTVRNALQQRGLAEENARLRHEVESRYEIVGRSHPIRALLDRIEVVGPTDARVLITGENGTGKELVARAIHRLSPRADGPFIEVNCAAIPAELIESELFGHVKGSFTGAFADRTGKFELAHGGTLFLDEVAEMEPDIQVKFLRALEQRSFRRLGGKKEIEVDIRVVAATNQNVEEALEKGKLREDVYHRLAVIPIPLPPLRDRGGDLILLAQEFLRRSAEEYGKNLSGFSDAALEFITTYRWPGNVRELKNAIERAVILATDESITPSDLQPRQFALEEREVHIPVGTSLREAERLVTLKTFAFTGGDHEKTATILGIPEAELMDQLRSFMDDTVVAN